MSGAAWNGAGLGEFNAMGCDQMLSSGVVPVPGKFSASGLMPSNMLISKGLGDWVATGSAGAVGCKGAGTMGSNEKLSACKGSGKKFEAGGWKTGAAAGGGAKVGMGARSSLLSAGGKPKSDSEKMGVPNGSAVGVGAGFGGVIIGAGAAMGGAIGFGVSWGVEKGSPKGPGAAVPNGVGAGVGMGTAIGFTGGVNAGAAAGLGGGDPNGENMSAAGGG